MRRSLCTLLLGLLLGTPWGAAADELVPSEEAPVVEATSLEQRVRYERQSDDNPFVIIPHKPNYLLPYSYNFTPNGAPFDASKGDIDNTEVKFQFSFKLPVVRGLFNHNGDLFFAYTNLSFWQAYNKDVSSPFRETNHEPELFLAFDNDWRLFGLTNTGNSLGIVHQSNGQSGSQSRSWNRIYALVTLSRGNFTLALKPWWRIPESEKSAADDPDGDDNPDIHRYLGYGEMYLFYKAGRQTFGVMLRNNLRDEGNLGAVQVDWSFPLTRKLKGYVQYFNGYGESLIDYNATTSRIGVGILLTDWL